MFILTKTATIHWLDGISHRLLSKTSSITPENRRSSFRCTATGSDDPFTHARTTRANWAERATVAPYWVNFHSEHHLFMAVPCYRLPVAHRLLAEKGLTSRMTIAPGYVAVLRMAGAAA